MTAETLIVWGLAASVSATLLFGLVMALRPLMANAFGARAALLLWFAPFLRLILPPLGLGLLPVMALRGSPGDPAALPPVMTPPAPAGGTNDAFFVPAVMTYDVVPAAAAGGSALPGTGLPGALLIVWLGGALLAFGFVLLESHSWRRTLLREAAPNPAGLDAEAARAARTAGYRGRYTLILSGAAASPQVTGIFAPLIALPLDFEERFSAEERHLALVHEYTHLTRGDLVIRIAAQALCALHWFNPLLRLALPRLAADQEAACDEAVRAKGAGARTYAGTLLRAAKGPMVPALTLNHDLKRRIETMKKPLPTASRRLLGTAAVAALAITGAAAMQEGGAALEEVVPMAGQEEATPRAEASGGKTGKRKRVVMVKTGNADDMMLLSDPFEKLTLDMPKPPEAVANVHVAVGVPSPAPVPPAPPVPEMRTKTDEDGTWMLMPGSAPDHAEFEERMEEFAERMEAWGERHGEELERLSEVRVERLEMVMDRFGDDMGAWGEKMGAVGEAVGDLGERCEEHKDRTAEPAIFSATVEETGDTVKAICVRGGKAQYGAAEIARFVAKSDALTAEEKAHFRKESRND